MYTRNKVLLGRASTATTSAAYYVGDFARMTVSRMTSTASATSIVIQGTNWDGFASAIPEGGWSNITVISTVGIFTVDPGFAYMRSIRSNIGASATSNETITLFGATTQ
jgi:hypothetical protein